MDLILMTTIGMGYLNTFIRTYSYMGMIHIWLFYVVSLQIYFIFGSMWNHIILGRQLFNRDPNNGSDWHIEIREEDFTMAAYSCTVVDVIFGILLGRVGLVEMLVIVIFSTIAYSFNSLLLTEYLKIYDVGGSVYCYVFGAYFGMGVSYMIGRFRLPKVKF